MSGVQLDKADLNRVSSGQIEGSPASLPKDWILSNGYLIGPGANLAGADLADIDLSEAKISGVRSGGITGLPGALPDQWIIVNGYLVGPSAKLEQELILLGVSPLLWPWVPWLWNARVSCKRLTEPSETER